MDGSRITRRIAIDVRGAWPVSYQHYNGPFESVYATLTILADGRSNRLNSDRSQDLWSWIRSCTVAQCLPVRQGARIGSRCSNGGRTRGDATGTRVPARDRRSRTVPGARSARSPV